MDMNFCRRCGQTLTKINSHTFKCVGGHTIYANAAPTVGIFILTDKNEVMLSVRGIEPKKGMLDSFGGFLDGAESLEKAAARELQEELSLGPEDYETLQYVTSSASSYVFGSEAITVMSSFFWTRFHTKSSIQKMCAMAYARFSACVVTVK